MISMYTTCEGENIGLYMSNQQILAMKLSEPGSFDVSSNNIERE